MSYFTETFESILELKSDIDKANTRRQLWDQQSGSHNHSFQKYNSKDAHEFGDDLNNKRDIRCRNRVNDDIKGQDDAYLKNRAADRARAKADPAYAEQKKKEAMEMRAKKAKHESFDPVYEDLCRMGIID